jgi:hypothetical protein
MSILTQYSWENTLKYFIIHFCGLSPVLVSGTHTFLVIVFCVTLLLICLTRLFLSDLEVSTAVMLYLFIFVRGSTRVMSIARYTAS